MSDKTKIEEQGWNELYAMWFECLNCGSIDIADGYNYCPNCGKEIDWEVGRYEK